MAIGSDGLGLISYERDDTGQLGVAHCEDLACTSADLRRLDDEGVSASGTSVAVGWDGLGLIAYSSSEGLKVAHCDDSRCTSASLSTVDELRSLGGASVVIGLDGLPLIGYRNGANGDLKVAHCEDVECRVVTVTTLVDDACCAGGPTDLTLGADGRGLFAYYDRQRGLRTAHCEDVACTQASFSTVLDGWSTHIAITISADGRGLFVFEQQGWQVARCRDLSCSGVDTAPLVHGWSLGDAAIAIGSDGLPLVAITRSLTGTVDGLTVGHCRDVACEEVTMSRISEAECAFDPSIAIGSDGTALVSCAGGDTNPVLIVAHCRDRDCSSAEVTTLDAPDAAGVAPELRGGP